MAQATATKFLIDYSIVSLESWVPVVGELVNKRNFKGWLGRVTWTDGDRIDVVWCLEKTPTRHDLSELRPKEARQDLSKLLIAVNAKLEAIGWIEVHRENGRRWSVIKEERLTNWAIAAIRKSNPLTQIETRLDGAPESRWIILSSMLTDEALANLDKRLTDEAKNK